MKTKKLYELPRNSKFTIANEPQLGEFRLECIDGMYSRCFDGKEMLYHIAAFTDVLPVSTGPTYPQDDN